MRWVITVDELPGHEGYLVVSYWKGVIAMGNMLSRRNRDVWRFRTKKEAEEVMVGLVLQGGRWEKVKLQALKFGERKPCPG